MCMVNNTLLIQTENIAGREMEDFKSVHMLHDS